MSAGEIDAAIYDYLHERNAKCIADLGHSAGGSVQFWHCGGRIIVIRRYGVGKGWEVYVPVSESNRVDDTLTALTAYLDN